MKSRPGFYQEVQRQVYGLIEDHKLMKICSKIEIFDSQSSPNHKSEYERFEFILFECTKMHDICYLSAIYRYGTGFVVGM